MKLAFKMPKSWTKELPTTTRQLRDDAIDGDESINHLRGLRLKALPVEDSWMTMVRACMDDHVGMGGGGAVDVRPPSGGHVLQRAGVDGGLKNHMLVPQRGPNEH